MILTELSAPAPDAIPVRAFAEHLRLGTGFADDGSLDGLLDLYLRAAMAAVEARIGRALLARPFSWTVTRWRDDAAQGLPVSPVQSVETLTLVAADGTGAEVDASQWALVRDSQRPRIAGRGGRNLPTVPRGGHAEIRFTAGYDANWAGTPPDLRQAVFLLAGHYFETRNEVEGGSRVMPFGVLVLLEAYRSVRIGGGLL